MVTGGGWVRGVAADESPRVQGGDVLQQRICKRAGSGRRVEGRERFIGWEGAE